jgi:hypothetical protein
MLASDFVLNWRWRIVVVNVECTVLRIGPPQFKYHAELAHAMAVAARRVGRGEYPPGAQKHAWANVADLRTLSLVRLDRKPRQ